MVGNTDSVVAMARLRIKSRGQTMTTMGMVHRAEWHEWKAIRKIDCGSRYAVELVLPGKVNGERFDGQQGKTLVVYSKPNSDEFDFWG